MQSSSLRQLAMLFALSALSVVQIGATTSGSDTMTLGDAVRYALAHSPRLAKAEAEAGIRGMEEENARARLFPSLDLSATHGLEKSLPRGPVVADESPVVSQLALTLTQPIYDNGETSTRREIAKVNREIAELAKGKARDDLILEVARSYYRLSLTDILLSIKQRQQELLSKQFRLTQSAYKQGLRTKKDFLRMQSETQRARVSAEESVARRAESEIALLELLGRDPAAGPVAFATITPDQASLNL